MIGRRGNGPIGPPTRCTLVALDVEGFTRPENDDLTQVRIRDRLFGALDDALAGLADPHPEHIRGYERGDGGIIVIGPAVPATAVLHRLLGPFPERLAAANAGQRPRIRVRLAVHSGAVLPDAYGVVGRAVNHVCRMRDSRSLHGLLATTSADLVALVSDVLVAHLDDAHRDPTRPPWQQVTERVKASTVTGWMRPCPAPATARTTCR